MDKWNMPKLNYLKNFKLQNNIFDSNVKITNSNDKYANTQEKYCNYVHPIT